MVRGAGGVERWRFVLGHLSRRTRRHRFGAVCVCCALTLAWTMPAPFPGFTWLVSSTLKMREDGWPRALPSKKVPFFRSVAANFSDRQLQRSTQRDAGARTRNIQQLRREFLFWPVHFHLTSL